jgi:DNA-binding transcriptional LysR family regulator
LARHFLLPELPDFLTQYPDIELFMSEGDRLVDPVREGIDCVVRVGKLKDSDMVARRLGELEEVTCAAPDYLQRFGTPHSISELEGHRMVGFRSSASGTLMPLEFTVAGQTRQVTLPCTVSVSAAESLVAAARMGLGIIQVPRYHLRDSLDNGSLLPLLPQFPSTPMPVSLLYPRNRQLSPRVRVFIDWFSKVFAARNR